MSRKTMSVILRVMLAGACVLCALFFFVCLPAYGQEMRVCYPEFAKAYWPCLIWAWVFSLPFFAAAIPAWQIFGTVAVKGAAFCTENAQRFRLIACLAFADAVIFPVGMLAVGLGFNAGSPALTVLVTPCVIAAGVCIGFVCWVLGRLVAESAEIREENELTV